MGLLLLSPPPLFVGPPGTGGRGLVGMKEGCVGGNQGGGRRAGGRLQEGDGGHVSANGVRAGPPPLFFFFSACHSKSV